MKTTKRFCPTCGGEKEYQVLIASETVVASGSSHVVASDSSHVVASDSSHVIAWESSHVEAWGNSHVVASKFVACHIYGEQVRCKGGVQIKVPKILTAKEWCDYYGVEVRRGIAVLFKGTDENFHTQKGVYYKPGTIPEAPDWDGGKAECGGGLHFSPCISATFRFKPDAKRFVACPVRIKDIVVHKNALDPNKIKARQCCAPVWEVDRDGNKKT